MFDLIGSLHNTQWPSLSNPDCLSTLICLCFPLYHMLQTAHTILSSLKLPCFVPLQDLSLGCSIPLRCFLQLFFLLCLPNFYLFPKIIIQLLLEFFTFQWVHSKWLPVSHPGDHFRVIFLFNTCSVHNSPISTWLRILPGDLLPAYAW